MVQETSNNPSQLKKITTGILIFISAFVVYFTVMSALAPSRKIKEMNEEYGFKQDGKTALDERILSDSAYLKQMRNKAFLQSRVTMAETDSVYLTINLADTVVNLEISGVVVHRTHINDYSVSKILLSGNEYTLINMMSKPFFVEKDYASIEKEPLMIKMAPKDTSEYQPDIMPDTADFEPVNYILHLSGGLKVYVYQYETLNSGDARHRFFFDLKDRIRVFAADFKRIIIFKIPEYHPYIKLRLPRDDAKIFYRALPVNGQIAVNR